jgi:acetolactate synthase-1/2/3 large subunit
LKVSDYIVERLISEKITDVFGYPGGMVTHLMESFRRYQDQISAHVTYHEQSAAFAACGYAQTAGVPGVAYATSGPGATNLITGICNAYFDSIPCIFLTGQVNTFEAKKSLGIRQRGFQETDIVSMVQSVTKYAAYISDPNKIKYYLDKAFTIANEGRKGPVLLDIPMNIFRADVDVDRLVGYHPQNESCSMTDAHKWDEIIGKALYTAQRPILLLGNGIKMSEMGQMADRIVNKLQIPVVTSMIAFDVIGNSRYNLGFIGAYGNRTAIFAVAKSDLVISIGARLDVRQVGAQRKNFAPEAKLIRIDIDKKELAYQVHSDEIDIYCTVEEVLAVLDKIKVSKDYSAWINVCKQIQNKLSGVDDYAPNKALNILSKLIPDDIVITTDVGQNQVWVAQSMKLKAKQKILFSGGHGAMGYSLPAAIGAYYGSGKKSVVCFTGDGGLQMNIQELQFLARERIPIKIVVLNNNALGMIRHFQEMYFDSEYFQTKPGGGYDAPNFEKVAAAYGIQSLRIDSEQGLKDGYFFTDDDPWLIEVLLSDNTYIFPKLEYGKANQDQEPLLSRELYNQIMRL